MDHILLLEMCTCVHMNHITSNMNVEQMNVSPSLIPLSRRPSSSTPINLSAIEASSAAAKQVSAFSKRKALSVHFPLSPPHSLCSFSSFATIYIYAYLNEPGK